MIRNDRSRVNAEHGFVHVAAEVDAGGTDNLRDNDALGTIDDKRAALCHNREISHKDFLFLDFFRLLVAQPDPNLQGACIGGIAGLAFLFGILRLVIHGIINETQFQVAGVVRHRVHILENLLQAGIQKPLIRALLNLQKVRHVHDLRCAGKTLAKRFPVENISWHWHTLLITNARVGCKKLSRRVDFTC